MRACVCVWNLKVVAGLNKNVDELEDSKLVLRRVGMGVGLNVTSVTVHSIALLFMSNNNIYSNL